MTMGQCQTCGGAKDPSFALEDRCVCDGGFNPWDADHTSLVHILWACQHDGLTLADDADKVAARIRSSNWMKAVRADARQDVDHLAQPTA